MNIADTLIPKDGKHKDEDVVVVEIIKPGVNKCLTLEGDYHYYDDEGFGIHQVLSSRRPYMPNVFDSWHDDTYRGSGPC